MWRWRARTQEGMKKRRGKSLLTRNSSAQGNYDTGKDTILKKSGEANYRHSPLKTFGGFCSETATYGIP